MARAVTRPTLMDVLVRQGILPKQTLDQVLSRLGGATVALGQTLVSEGILSEDQLACALAAQFDLPCDLLTEFRVDQSFYDSMSVKLMQRHPFIPIAEHQGRLGRRAPGRARDRPDDPGPEPPVVLRSDSVAHARSTRRAHRRLDPGDPRHESRRTARADHPGRAGIWRKRIAAVDSAQRSARVRD